VKIVRRRLSHLQQTRQLAADWPAASFLSDASVTINIFSRRRGIHETTAESGMVLHEFLFGDHVRPRRTLQGKSVCAVFFSGSLSFLV
jgi:hypothetical protein